MNEAKHQYRINIDRDLFDTLTEVAHQHRVSVNQLIVDTLAERFHEQRHAITIAWIKVARWGELSDRDEEGNPSVICPECGQDIDKGNCFVALLSNGQHCGPVCDICATSE